MVWPTELFFRLVRQSRSVYPRVIGSWSLTHVLNLFIFTPEGSLNEFIHYSQQIWVMSSWNNKVGLRFNALTINKRINVMVDLGRYFFNGFWVLFVGCVSIFHRWRILYWFWDFFFSKKLHYYYYNSITISTNIVFKVRCGFIYLHGKLFKLINNSRNWNAQTNTQ